MPILKWLKLWSAVHSFGDPRRVLSLDNPCERGARLLRVRDWPHIRLLIWTHLSTFTFFKDVSTSRLFLIPNGPVNVSVGGDYSVTDSERAPGVIGLQSLLIFFLCLIDKTPSKCLTCILGRVQNQSPSSHQLLKRQLGRSELKKDLVCSCLWKLWLRSD